METMEVPVRINDDWITPPYILDAVDKFYENIWSDPCPVGGREKFLSVYSVNPAANHEAWRCNKLYINPPFSEYVDWAEYGVKFINETNYSKPQQIWMMHHDSSTRRMKILLEHASAVCLLHERVKFIDPVTGEASKNSDKAKSQTLVYLGYRPNEFRRNFSHLGTILFCV